MRFILLSFIAALAFAANCGNYESALNCVLGTRSVANIYCGLDGYVKEMDIFTLTYETLSCGGMLLWYETKFFDIKTKDNQKNPDKADYKSTFTKGTVYSEDFAKSRRNCDKTMSNKKYYDIKDITCPGTLATDSNRKELGVVHDSSFSFSKDKSGVVSFVSVSPVFIGTKTGSAPCWCTWEVILLICVAVLVVIAIIVGLVMCLGNGKGKGKGKGKKEPKKK